MNPKVQTILADLRRRFEEIYGERLVRMVLFGSQARGDAEPGSDIDILVVLQGPVKPGQEIARTGEITATLSLKYDVVVSCTFVSADRYATEQSPLLLNVRKEGVPV
jgi:predicted nucleotidyltransferase